MIYFENTSYGKEGFNTHALGYIMCVSFSNFLDRDFFFDYVIPCSTPPEYAEKRIFGDKFDILMTSPRSLVTDLLKIPARRVFEIDRNIENKAEYVLLFDYFASTEEMREKFESTFIWQSFGVGRTALIRERLQEFDLIEWKNPKLSSPALFYFLPAAEKRQLMESVKIAYLPEIEKLAEKVISGFGKFYAIHLRMGDFFVHYKPELYSIDVERFSKYIAAAFPDSELPVLIATDGLKDKDVLNKLFPNYKIVFIDEMVFEEFREEYASLSFTDFNVLTILNQLICAAAETFIGTYRSTFTGAIHRLRQERYGKRDFNFFPDGKIAQLLNDKMEIVPDSNGFFDWNRYSILSDNHISISWMREWDHERSILNV